MITPIKNKTDLVKALSQRDLLFKAEIEVVNDAGLKSIVEKARSLLRQNRKLHIVVIERK